MKWIAKFFRRVFRLDKDEDTGTYLVKQFYDPGTKSMVLIELMCLCGWNASPFDSDTEDNYWCEHCDRSCAEGLPTCYYCDNLATADVEEIRKRYNHEEEN
jgi:hypothetical protein